LIPIPEDLKDLQKYFCYEIEGELHDPQVKSAEFIAEKITEYMKCVCLIEGEYNNTSKL